VNAFFVACFAVAKSRCFSKDRGIRGRLPNDIKVDGGCCNGGCSDIMMKKGRREEKEERQEAMEW
jgi:hypothetical protein